MNIKEAKEQIKNAIIAYFTKDEYGDYEISIEDQRPVFLMGPPGIGKTAIMEQIAAELGIGLVSYSMTHHTRQSALGLPYILTKTYGGKEYSVSNYTMSEIIGSMYDLMEETGFREGILFLDEINCVSETLAPSMLQFLQYKMFGRHRVPDGWIVVTAGNPPEYNNSVREFDTVTWDRVKRIDIEPDYRIWKEYAMDRGVHPSISTYLDIKTNDFYRIESTVDGKTIVTARAAVDVPDSLGKDVYDELVDRIINALEGQVIRIVLYGSVARGTNEIDSDIDIAVFVHERLDHVLEDRLSDVIVDMNLKYNKIFSVIDIDESVYLKWKNVTPFYQNVEKEGIVLWKAA